MSKEMLERVRTLVERMGALEDTVKRLDGVVAALRRDAETGVPAVMRRARQEKDQGREPHKESII